MRATIREQLRNKILASLLESEILRRENALYECAVAVENDQTLKADLAAWDVTTNDGLRDDFSNR